MVIGPVHYALQACLPKYGGLQLFFIDVPFLSDFKSYVMVFILPDKTIGVLEFQCHQLMNICILRG